MRSLLALVALLSSTWLGAVIVTVPVNLEISDHGQAGVIDAAGVLSAFVIASGDPAPSDILFFVESRTNQVGANYFYELEFTSGTNAMTSATFDLNGNPAFTFNSGSFTVTGTSIEGLSPLINNGVIGFTSTLGYTGFMRLGNAFLDIIDNQFLIEFIDFEYDTASGGGGAGGDGGKRTEAQARQFRLSQVQAARAAQQALLRQQQRRQ